MKEESEPYLRIFIELNHLESTTFSFKLLHGHSSPILLNCACPGNCHDLHTVMMKWNNMSLSDVERGCFVVSCDSAAPIPSRCLFLWLRKLLINFKWRFAERLRFPQIPSQSDLRYRKELVLILMGSTRLLPKIVQTAI